MGYSPWGHKGSWQVCYDSHTHTHTRDWFMFQASSDEKQSQKRYIRSGGQRGQSGLTWLGDPTCSVVNKINK